MSYAEWRPCPSSPLWFPRSLSAHGQPPWKFKEEVSIMGLPPQSRAPSPYHSPRRPPWLIDPEIPFSFRISRFHCHRFARMISFLVALFRIAQWLDALYQYGMLISSSVTEVPAIFTRRLNSRGYYQRFKEVPQCNRPGLVGWLQLAFSILADLSFLAVPAVPQHHPSCHHPRHARFLAWAFPSLLAFFF